MDIPKESLMPAPDETRENRIKRLKMRSWRRGTKEMDMILGPFSDTEIDSMSDTELDLYDALLWENDQELYTWVNGSVDAPEKYNQMISVIYKHKLSK